MSNRILGVILILAWLAGCASAPKEDHATAVGPLAVQDSCVKKAREWLDGLGGKYTATMHKLDERKFPSEIISSMTLCNNPEARQIAPLVAWGFYHEAHHMLGSFGDLYWETKDKPNPTPAGEEGPYPHSSWRLYYWDAPAQHVSLPYFAHTLQLRDIFEDVQNYAFLTHLNPYLIWDGSSRNFYMLLEEWNAYVESLDSAVASLKKTDGKVIFSDDEGHPRALRPTDQGNAVFEFALYAAKYLQRMAKEKPPLAKKLQNSRSIKSSIADLVHRSDSVLIEAKPFPLLFLIDKQRLLEPVYREARQYLLAWSAK